MKTLLEILTMAVATSITVAAYEGGACCGQPLASEGENKVATTPDVKADAEKAQATCPVMGGKVNKDIFVDVKGFRVYVCCKGCIAQIKADPEKYIEKVKANGETLAASPACEKCKEPVGSDKCCK